MKPAMVEIERLGHWPVFVHTVSYVPQGVPAPSHEGQIHALLAKRRDGVTRRFMNVVGFLKVVNGEWVDHDVD